MIFAGRYMEEYHAVGSIIAGVGFFFFGFRLLSSGLRALYSRRLRLSLAALTSRRSTASLFGVVSGVLIQSAPCFTFVQAGASSAGLVNVRRILPVIFWVNVGCSLLVRISVFNVSFLAPYVLGLCAIAWAFIRNRTWKLRVEVLLSVALIFYGLHSIKTGAAQAVSYPYIAEMVILSGESLVWAFFAGVALAAITQSSIAVTMVALSLARIGLFNLNQLILLVYGTMVGVSLLVWTLSWKLKGNAKQIALAQVLFDAGGVVLFLLLFVIEYYAGIPMVVALVSKAGADLSQQVANLYVFFNVAVACVFTLNTDGIHSILASLYPPTKEEMDSRASYLASTIHLDPGAAMDVVAKELFLNIAKLQTYLACTEANMDGKTSSPWETVRTPFMNVSSEIDSVLDDLSRESLSPGESAALMNLRRKQELSRNIENELAMLTRKIPEVHGMPELAVFARGLFEASNAIWTTFLAYLHSRDDYEGNALMIMTSDKGDLLARLRSAYADRIAAPGKKGELTDLIVHFERWVWLLNRFVLFLKSEEEMFGNQKTA